MTDYLKIARAAAPGCVKAMPSPAVLVDTPVTPAMKSEPDPAELARASAVLNRAGVRVLALEGRPAIGVWSDLDGPEIRAALRVIGLQSLPVRYLDGSGIPMRYKVRRVEGQPVPLSVLIEMERHTSEPWAGRDRLLKALGWRSKPIVWSDSEPKLQNGSRNDLSNVWDFLRA